MSSLKMKTRTLTTKESKPELTTYDSTNNISKQYTAPTNRKYKPRCITASSTEEEDEKEFGKFLEHSPNNSNHSKEAIDAPIKSYRPPNPIKGLIKPKMRNLNQYQASLSTTLLRAKTAYSTFASMKEKYDKDSLKYFHQRERLKGVYQELKRYETGLEKRSEKLETVKAEIERDNEALIKEEKLLKTRSLQFNSYIDFKTKELKDKGDKNRRCKEAYRQRLVNLIKREKELTSKKGQFILLKDEIKNKEIDGKLRTAKVSIEKSLPLAVNWNSIEQLRTKSKAQFDQATLDHLQNEIDDKKEELAILNKKHLEFDNRAKAQSLALSQRVNEIDQGQTNLSKLKQDLQSKLTEVETALAQTKSITKHLKDKSDFIRHLQRLEKKKHHLITKRYTYQLNTTH